jgi:hypothetical protein
MSLGTWVLSATGGLSGIAAGCEVLGIMPRVRDASGFGAAALAPVLSTYTAALIADTAVPVWHGAQLELPFVFGATSLATAGAVSIMLNPPQSSATARALCIGGAVAATAGVEVMERRLGPLAQPYHNGDAGTFGLAAKALSPAGALIVALSGRRRLMAAAGAAAVLAGGACERWSIFRAGSESAKDPKHTVQPQRERLQRGGGHRGAEERGEISAP